METMLKRQSSLRPSEKTREIIVDIICYLFVALFIYTAASKFITMDTFKHVLIKYPLIGKYHSIIAYLVPLIEIFVGISLIIPATKKIGLMACSLLMTLFLGYILYMFYSGSQLPCSCGGLIAKLSWQNHIWFNLIFIVLAITGIQLHRE